MCRNANVCTRNLYIFYNNSPCPNHTILANADPITYNCTYADPCSFSDFYCSGQFRSNGYMYVILYYIFMFDCCIGIDNTVVSDLGTWINDSICHNNTSNSD